MSEVVIGRCGVPGCRICNPPPGARSAWALPPPWWAWGLLAVWGCLVLRAWLRLNGG